MLAASAEASPPSRFRRRHAAHRHLRREQHTALDANRYDLYANVVLAAQPSAFNPSAGDYDHSLPADLMDSKFGESPSPYLNNDSGLIDVYTYYERPQPGRRPPASPATRACQIVPLRPRAETNLATLSAVRGRPHLADQHGLHLRFGRRSDLL